MANISFRHVDKTYDSGNTVIKDLNLEINDKEFVVLVGPSGCGKSTTLRMIAGLEEISAGDVYIGDTRVNDLAPKDRDIAMVFQSYALYPHMSVYKNMAFSLQLKKVDKETIDKKVREVAKVLELEPFLDRKPKQLSGGQRQRVALGRAMVRNPKVFLLDEPLSNLDAKLRTEMRSQISQLHKRLETTFVYVTHDQTEAMTMGDRICVMKDGFIQQFDTPQNLYNHPDNMFVATFIGSPQMNLIAAKVSKVDDGYKLTYGENEIVVDRDLSAYVDKSVMIGIRPENVDVATESSNPKHCVKASVNLVELMGSESYLYLNSGNQKMIARVSSDLGIKEDSDITIELNMDKLHLFDISTEKVIR